MTPIESLAAANFVFVASHFAMSHPLRKAMVSRLGEGGFAALYSLVSFALLAWIVTAFRQAPAGPLLWNGTADLVWVLSSILTIVATAMLLGSLRNNPALPGSSARSAAGAQAIGAFAVTRHPMMWAIGLWAIAHLLAWPGPRTLITAGSMGFLALVGAHMQDRKKEALLGDAWAQWESRTSYWPRFHKLGQIGWVIWLAAVAVWLAFTWLHVWLVGIPAGAWRWLG